MGEGGGSGSLCTAATVSTGRRVGLPNWSCAVQPKVHRPKVNLSVGVGRRFMVQLSLREGGNSAIHILMFHATYQVVHGASRCVRALSAKGLVRCCLCARAVQSLRTLSEPNRAWASP